MGRRRRSWEQKERASIGDVHVENAVAKLRVLSQRTVAARVKRQFTTNQIVHMMFEPDTIRRATEARGVVDERFTSSESYPLSNQRYGNGATLYISYEHEPMLAIKAECYRYYARQEPFLQFFDEVYAIYRKFEEVVALLRWLNRNATPGAVRYYFPPAMKLTPAAPIWTELQEVPSRYNEPGGISDWIQTIKDAANTVAASALLPADVKPAQATGMTLTFGSTAVVLSDRTSYVTNSVTYQI